MPSRDYPVNESEFVERGKATLDCPPVTAKLLTGLDPAPGGVGQVCEEHTVVDVESGVRTRRRTRSMASRAAAGR